MKLAKERAPRRAGEFVEIHAEFDLRRPNNESRTARMRDVLAGRAVISGANADGQEELRRKLVLNLSKVLAKGGGINRSFSVND